MGKKKMIHHRVMGPTDQGRYLVFYETAGQAQRTVVADCSTKDQAEMAAKRLNAEGLAREKAAESERDRKKYYRIRFKNDRGGR